MGGHEIFSLVGQKSGVCMFRIAYAREWEFKDFKDYSRKNGDLIELKVMVSESGVCNPNSDEPCIGTAPRDFPKDFGSSGNDEP